MPSRHGVKNFHTRTPNGHSRADMPTSSSAAHLLYFFVSELSACVHGVKCVHRPPRHTVGRVRSDARTDDSTRPAPFTHSRCRKRVLT